MQSSTFKLKFISFCFHLKTNFQLDNSFLIVFLPCIFCFLDPVLDLIRFHHVRVQCFVIVLMLTELLA